MPHTPNLQASPFSSTTMDFILQFTKHFTFNRNHLFKLKDQTFYLLDLK